MADPTELHPLVAGFADAEVYERGRVGYPAPVVEAIGRALGLQPGATVLDLGAGTGKLTRALLAAGYDAIAVEPMEDMRRFVTTVIGAERVREGAAEAIPLEDDSVDGITCAESFHWFDERRAMPEIRRVLRPGRGIVIVHGEPQVSAPWAKELADLLIRGRPDHPAFGERPPAAALDDDPAFGPVAEDTVASQAEIDREGILAGVASASWIGAMPVQERRAVLARVEALLAREGVTEFSHGVIYRLWSARLLDQ